MITYCFRFLLKNKYVNISFKQKFVKNWQCLPDMYVGWNYKKSVSNVQWLHATLCRIYAEYIIFQKRNKKYLK